MTTLLLAVLGKIWPYVLGAVALAIGWFTAKAKGRSEAKATALETSVAVERDWNKAQKNAQKETDTFDDTALRERAAKRMRDEQGK